MERDFADVGPDDKPRLTAYGEKCLVVMKSCDGDVPDFDGCQDARLLYMRGAVGCWA